MMAEQGTDLNIAGCFIVVVVVVVVVFKEK